MVWLLITTNKAFSEWGEVFPNASCVVAMIDRWVHHAEILSIKGESFRRKDAQEAATAKSKTRIRRWLHDAASSAFWPEAGN